VKKVKRRNEGKRKSRIKSPFFILLIVVAVSVFTILLSQYFLIEKIQTFNVFISVADRVAFNISKGAGNNLHFGTAPPGSSSSRTLVFDSSDPRPSKVIIKSYGQIKDWIIASENNFILESNEDKNVTLTILIPQNAEFGSYTGKIKLIFRKYWF